jgi:hypothetical protein
MVGLGLGPSVVAAFTDYVFKDDALVGYSMAAAIMIFGLAAALLFIAGRGPMRRAVRSVAGSDQPVAM